MLIAEMQDALTVTADSDRGRLHLRDGTELLRCTVPAPAALGAQAAVVAGYADLRPEQLAEILVQCDDLDGFFDAVGGIPGPCGALLAGLAADLATSVA